MKIDLTESPINKIVSIEGNIFTLECTCGKLFTQEMFEEGNVISRCETCNNLKGTISNLSETQKADLFEYMFTEVLSVYHNKFNKGNS